MIFTIVIAFVSLIGLIILHEFGHFVLAKILGVKVEEFGLGYPPRLFGKKFGETVYSLNILPFGGFVKIYGQEEIISDSRSFSQKPFWKKAIIILGGVFSFWVISAILLSIVMIIGAPTIVEDDQNQGLIEPKIQIVSVSEGSPAWQAGLKVGDVINGFDKVREVQEFTKNNAGKKVSLTIQRGKEVFDVFVILRVPSSDNEGALGVGLARTALKTYPWYQAPLKGISATGSLTWLVIKSWGMVLGSLFSGQGLPPGVKIIGPVKIFEWFIDVGGMGISYFLQFIAIIAVQLALVNILPIPALDGGWLLFMVIERLRGKPLNQKIVQRITATFFFLLLGLMVLVTARELAPKIQEIYETVSTFL